MDATGNLIEILKSRKDLEAKFGTGPDSLGSASFEEERREVLESVLETLAEPGVDADRLAACAGLLRGLMGRPAFVGGRLRADAPAYPEAGRAAARRQCARQIAWRCTQR